MLHCVRRTRNDGKMQAGLEDAAARIPSMGGRKLGPLLREAARRAPGGTAVVEAGSWLGAGTAQLALGIRDRERPDVTLHCFDRWRTSPDEVAAAARAGLRLKPFEDTLPHVRRMLEPIGVPIRFHRGDLEHARWDGGAISVYVDDVSKQLPIFCHALATFAPSWIPGETTIFLMDFHHWRKSKAREDEFQRRFIEAAGSCFEPIEVRTATSLAMFRYKAALGAEVWAWLLDQSLEALAEAQCIDLTRKLNKVLQSIQSIGRTRTWSDAAERSAYAARRIAYAARRMLAHLRSPHGPGA